MGYYFTNDLTNLHGTNLFKNATSHYGFHDIDTILRYQAEINDSLKDQQKLIDTLNVHMRIASRVAAAGTNTSAGATPTPATGALTGRSAPAPTTNPGTAVTSPGRTTPTGTLATPPLAAGAVVAAATSLIPTLSAQLIAAQNKLHQYKTDSVRLSHILLGKQKGVGLRASIFQSIPALTDDNPKNFTNYHLDLTFPINRFHGKIRLKNNNTVWVFFRNFSTSFTGVFSNKSLGARDTVSSTDTIQNNTGKWVHKRYVNLLDLRQFAFLTATAYMNLGTSVGRYYTWYFDVFASLSRTNIYHNADSLYAMNFGQYGLSVTGKTTFTNSPINARLNAQLFWIDPNTNSVSFLNSQYSKMANESIQPFSMPGLEKQTYIALNFTIQYRMPSNPAPTTPKASSSSAISGSTSAFLYAFFGYNSALTPGPRHLRSTNNYLTLQLGYSTDLQTLAKGISTALGINTN